MSKNSNNNKKGWRPGRNPLTLIIILAAFLVIFIAIFTPVSYFSNKKAGQVEYFQDSDNVSALKAIYSKDNLMYYEDYTYYQDFKVKLEASSYNDVQREVFDANKYNNRVETTSVNSNNEEVTKVTYENEFSGDTIKFNLTLSLPEGKEDLSSYKPITSNYVVYASISVATNWIADHSILTTLIKFTDSNITSSVTKENYELKCKASYPARKTTVWPFYTTVESPDVYLYLYYLDSKGDVHQDIIKYPYSAYRTNNTNGAIIKP